MPIQMQSRWNRWSGNGVGKEECGMIRIKKHQLCRKWLCLFLEPLLMLMSLMPGAGIPVRADDPAYVLIGDSRTEDMHNTVGDQGAAWSFQVGAGITWLKGEGTGAIDGYITKGSAVVIMMGVNDIKDTFQTANYAEFINQKAAEWKTRGASTYYVSVTPVDESKDSYETNEDIETWNSSIQGRLSDDVTYLDLYSQLAGQVNTASDGLHYEADTSQKIFDLIKQDVQNGGTGSGEDVDTSALDPDAAREAQHADSSGTTVSGHTPGWDGLTYYDQYGNPVTGWQEIDGSRYFFDDNGRAKTGFQKFNDGNTYYFGQDGKMLTGWQEYQGHRYFGSDGAMLTGWQTLDGRRYYLGEDGKAMTGWQTIDGQTYYFGDDYIMKTGWQSIDGADYFLKKDGTQVTGWLKLDGRMYYLDPSTGAKVKAGDHTIKSRVYRFRQDGTLFYGWDKADPAKIRYFSENGMAVGLTQIDGKAYYFDSDGCETFGWQDTKTGRIYLDKDGTAVFGWQEIDGQRYYFSDQFIMVTNWQRIGQDKYYFGKEGVCATGWQDINGSRYYFADDGRMQTGWQEFEGKRYFFDQNGRMQTGRAVVQGTAYLFGPDGHLTTGWLAFHGRTYYADGKGHVVTGLHLLDGKLCLLDSSGQLLIAVRPWQGALLAGVIVMLVSLIRNARKKAAVRKQMPKVRPSEGLYRVGDTHLTDDGGIPYRKAPERSAARSGYREEDERHQEKVPTEAKHRSVDLDRLVRKRHPVPSAPVRYQVMPKSKQTEQEAWTQDEWKEEPETKRRQKR